MSTGTYREYRSDFVRHFIEMGRDEGEPLGWAQGVPGGRVDGAMRALFTVLDARGLVLSDEAMERMPDAGDLDGVDHWIRHAATADSAAEFDA